MDKRILKYINEKNTWARLGNLVADYINGVKDLRASMNKAYKVMKEKEMSQDVIDEWVETKKRLIEGKEKSLDTVQSAYTCLDAHLSDAIDLRRSIKSIVEKLENGILEKGKFPSELMSQQKTELNKIVKTLKAIDKDSKEISEKTKHII